MNGDDSTAKRSQVTGRLLITMPKVKQIIAPKAAPSKNKKAAEDEKKKKKADDDRWVITWLRDFLVVVFSSLFSLKSNQSEMVQ